jgi:hypothetical protein
VSYVTNGSYPSGWSCTIGYPADILSPCAKFSFRLQVRRAVRFFAGAALAEVHRLRRPIDSPAVRRAFEQLMQTAERRDPISTAEALKARDRGRR